MVMKNENQSAFRMIGLGTTLFMRADQVEAAWELIMPILNHWESKTESNFPNYSADSWGPENAEALIAKDGFHWFNLPDKNKED